MMQVSMTREEAIDILQEKHDECKAFYDLAAHPEDTYPSTTKYLYSLDMAIAALRPISRERVEKVWGSEWIGDTDEKVGTIDGSPMKSATCFACGNWLVGSDEYDCSGHFCPACGRAMTDEAVQMVMERLEALHENRD